MAMCERDDCTSIQDRRTGQTIICAYLTEINPPTLKDHTGVYTMNCDLPTGVALEKNDLYLYHVVFNGERQTCTRVTPIPTILYGVYRKILEEYRKARINELNKTMKK